MSIEKRLFGKANGKDVYAFTLDNNNGLKVEILTYGGILKNMWYKDVDVLLGRATLEDYFENIGYMGALIGRNSNRIKNCEFTLNGKTYKLYDNDNGNNLHGGKEGFDRKVWDYEVINGEEPSLVLSTVSPDMEEGFPGEVHVKVTYTLTRENSIKIQYEGMTDKDTILNMTNHAYFNLNGYNNGLVDDHVFMIDSSFFTPNKEDCMPYGDIWTVENTPFDFRTPKTLGEGFKSDYEQIKMFGGYDHNFVLNGEGFRKVIDVTGDKTGIKMEVYTDLPGVQLYTGNMINEELTDKDGNNLKKHQAFCLETQVYPNGIEFPHYPSSILRKGEKYETVTEYKFI
ncbi:MAG: galactose mutarotase [Clostridia bacterium]|nr:galactose mutarotase [Clostridia bacterium]